MALEACDIDPARLAQRPIFHDPWPPVVDALSALRDEALACGVGGRLCAESLANVIAVHLVRRFAGSPAARAAARGAVGRLAGPALRAVVEYVMDNLDGDLALADLAAVAGLSEFHFARRTRWPPARARTGSSSGGGSSGPRS